MNKIDTGLVSLGGHHADPISIMFEDMGIVKNLYRTLLATIGQTQLVEKNVQTREGELIEFNGKYVKIQMERRGDEGVMLKAFLGAFDQPFVGEYELAPMFVPRDSDFREQIITFTKLILSCEGFTELDLNAMREDITMLCAKGLRFDHHEDYVKELLLFTKAATEAQY